MRVVKDNIITYMGTNCASRFSKRLSNQGLTRNLGRIVGGTSD
jgi:hypothetical protein